MSIARLPVAGSHLFVASNLGQVRNATAVVDQLGLGDATVVVLWTPAGTDLKERLVELAAELGLPARTLELPRSPTDRFPKTISRMVSTYRLLSETLPADNVWIANTNRHYGVLAGTYEAAGSSIHYYEEGLGSYRRADDPVYAGTPLSSRVRSLQYQVRATATDPSISWFRKARRIGHRLAALLVDTQMGRMLNSLMIGSAARDVYFPRTRFGIAAAAFPGLLDHRVVDADRYVRIDPTPPPSDREGAGATVIESVRRPPCPTLLLSQAYEPPATAWAAAIAAELHALDIDAVVIKFHPREAADRRSAISQALVDHGVRASATAEFDHWTAEQVIESGGFDRVVGLTSSTLIYRPSTVREVEYISIGRGVLEELESDPGVAELDLHRFRSDLELYERVAAAITGESA